MKWLNRCWGDQGTFQSSSALRKSERSYAPIRARPKISRTGDPKTPREGGPMKFKVYLPVFYDHDLIDIYSTLLEHAPLVILMAYNCV